MASESESMVGPDTVGLVMRQHIVGMKCLVREAVCITVARKLRETGRGWVSIVPSGGWPGDLTPPEGSTTSQYPHGLATKSLIRELLWDI